MDIGYLIWWIYVMDMPDAAMLAFLGTILFCWVHQKLEDHRLWRWLRGCILVAVLGAVLYITLGQRSGSGEYGIHLMPFHSYREAAAMGNREIYRSNFMNVLLFCPVGLLAVTLLPKGWPRWLRLAVTVLCFTALSGGIEYLQYRNAMGRCEIDDVIHNGLGAFLGAAAGMWITPLWYWMKQKWEGI